jgi:hypothetical protein
LRLQTFFKNLTVSREGRRIPIFNDAQILLGRHQRFYPRHVYTPTIRTVRDRSHAKDIRVFASQKYPAGAIVNDSFIAGGY